MFPVAVLLKLRVFFSPFPSPRISFPTASWQWQNPKIQQIKRHKIFMEQSRFLGYGLVGRTGQGKESTVQGVHLQPRLWRRLHSSVCPNS